MKNPPKKISLTCEELLSSQSALHSIANLRLPVKTSYWIGKTLKKIMDKAGQRQAEIEKNRVALIKALGKEITVEKDGIDTGTGQFQVLPENNDKFQGEYKKLMDEKIEIEVVPIELALLGESMISPADISALYWLLIE